MMKLSDRALELGKLIARTSDVKTGWTTSRAAAISIQAVVDAETAEWRAMGNELIDVLARLASKDTTDYDRLHAEEQADGLIEQLKGMMS